MQLNRRTLLAGSAAGFLSRASRAATTEPVKVGLLMAKTGVYASGGRHMENGLRFFLDERKNELAGRKIEVITADAAGTPSIAKSKAQELIERYNVDVLVGPFSTAEALAIAAVVEQAKVPLILSSAGADDLTQRKRSPWMVRSVATSSEFGYVLAAYSLKSKNYKRIAAIAGDTNYGYETVGGFQKVFEAGGGKVIQKIWAPIGASDMAPYASQIDRGCDAIFCSLAGTDSLHFMKIAQDYGLRENCGMLCPSSTVDETLLPELGDSVLGAISTSWYSPTAETPGGMALAQAFRAKYKLDPGTLSTGSILAGMILESALTSLNGDVSDKEAVARALHQATVPSGPFGAVKLDQYGNAVLNMFVRETVRKNGVLVNAAVAEFPAVSQFWTFDPQEQLNSSPYSRA